MIERTHPAVAFTSESAQIQRTSAPYSRRPDVIALAILFVAVLVAVGSGLTSGLALYRLDVVSFYLPWYSHLGERLRDLDIPGWLPYTMSGVPFSGDPQSGWGYLPAMVIFTIFPNVTGFKLFILFHAFLAAFSSYAFARVLGLGAIGALTAGVAFTFSNFMERTICCTIHMQLAVWVPVAMLGIELAFRAERWSVRLRWLLLTGAACSQILASWIGQGAYYGMLAVGTYLAYRVLIARHPGAAIPRRFGELAVASAVVLAIAAALAAPALMPRLDTISRSNLADLYDEGDASSDSPNGWTPIQLADRLLSPDERSGRWYLGAALVALTLTAPLLAGRRGRTIFFSIYGLAILSLFLQRQPLGDLLGILPRFTDLHRHLPDRVIVVFFIAPAILIGSLVDRMVRPTAGRPAWWR